MTTREKWLYHQIHPVKLLIDWGAGLLSLHPLWLHKLGLGIAAMLIPPLLASFLIVRFADLEPSARSQLGKNVARSMSRMAEAIRLLGMAIMAFGAWSHAWAVIGAGLLVVAAGWLQGTRQWGA